MKYLLLGAAFAALATLGQAQEDLFGENRSYNDDVNRKINLAAEGVVEI